MNRRVIDNVSGLLLRRIRLEQLHLFWNYPRKVKAREWIFQIHLWLGIILGSIIALDGFTGAVIVFRYEINRLTTPGTAYVAPATRRLPLDTLIAAVMASRPKDSLQDVTFYTGPDVAWNVRTRSEEGHRIQTYVDQYRGVVTSQDDYNLRWTQWFYDLHAHLLGGKTATSVNGFVALISIVVALSGIIVWWPGKANCRAGFTYATTAGWRRQTYDLHKLTGFFGSGLLLIVSLTGAYFIFPKPYLKAMSLLTSMHVTHPDIYPADLPRAKTLMAARQVPYEEYIVRAERAMPGMRAVFIGFPEHAGDALSVYMKAPRDWHRIGLSDVYLEPATADVLLVERFDDLPVGLKLVRLMLPFHFGRFGERFGNFANYAVMVLYVLIGLAPAVLMTTGYLMYWNRSLSKKVRRRHLADARSSLAASPRLSSSLSK